MELEKKFQTRHKHEKITIISKNGMISIAGDFKLTLARDNSVCLINVVKATVVNTDIAEYKNKKLSNTVFSMRNIKKIYEPIVLKDGIYEVMNKVYFYNNERHIWVAPGDIITVFNNTIISNHEKAIEDVTKVGKDFEMKKLEFKEEIKKVKEI